LFVVTIDATEEAAGLAYAEQQRTFLDLCRRCGLAVLAATSPTAPAASHAYLYLSEDGMERVLLCDGCGYAALEQEASSGHPNVEAEAVLPLERVATPHASTIADLAQYLCVPESRTAKAVFRTASVDEGERFVFAVVRGDTDVSEEKLRATLRTLGVRASALRAATDAEIRATGATPGYASPVGLKNVLVVVDELAARSPNLVAGANEEGYHLLNTNNGRDYQASVVADIALAKAGDSCPACGHALRGATAALLARSERVPTEKGGPAYLDATGRSQPVWIGIHLVDLGALLAAVASERCDEQGLALPPAAAPFAVHLVGMPGADAEVEALYRSLWDSGLPCLWDDRGDSAGVKFTDADLIGLPVRITLGKRSLQAGGAEFKRREPGAAGGEKWIVPLDAAIETARRVLTEVEANAIAGIKELRYGEHLR
jgi:prolyl-tRNA synthetase